jgi:hypothetical protein
LGKRAQKPVSQDKRFPRKFIPCRSPGPSDEEKGLAYAEMLNSPEVAAYRVIGMMLPKGLSEEMDVPCLIETLKTGSKAVQKGDLAQAEAMLVNQAYSLQALFVRLSERAMEQSHMPSLEGFMRLALRSQAQCRATLETLSVIKNPPVVYAKQANVTTGPQQINNGLASQAREIKNEQNQLSGGLDELRADTRASNYAGGDDSPLEALGEVDRTKDSGRQG